MIAVRYSISSFFYHYCYYYYHNCYVLQSSFAVVVDVVLAVVTSSNAVRGIYDGVAVLATPFPFTVWLLLALWEEAEEETGRDYLQPMDCST